MARTVGRVAVGLALVAVASFHAQGVGGPTAGKFDGLAAAKIQASAHAHPPLGFAANHGQSAPQVRFMAQGSGYRLFLTPTEAVLALAPAEPARDPAVLRLTPLDANPSPAVVGEQPLTAKANYVSGSDPHRWHTDVPTYAKVAVRDVYPGVDVTYYGNQRQLEYDFVVAPGADPATIRLGLKGATSVTVSRGGDLLVDTAAGTLVQHRPVAYQQRGGTRRVVPASYVVSGRDEVRLRLGRYEHDRPLVIDPVITYSTYLGGQAGDVGEAIAVDAQGSAYVTGYTYSPDFPTAAAFDDTLGPGVSGGRALINAFVTKLDPSGSRLVYSTYLGGQGVDKGTSIAVDAAGNAYVGGSTNSTDFPTVAAFQPTYTSPYSQNCSYRCYSRDGFVAKLNPTGSALVYSTYLGGSHSTSVDALAIDGSGNAYVAGTTNSFDFPTTPGAFQPSYHGGPNPCCGQGKQWPPDAFVTKFAPDGSLVYSTFLGGSCGSGSSPLCGSDEAEGIAVDAGGNAFVVGDTASEDFPTTPGAYDRTYGGGIMDAFVTKLDPAGSTLVYSTLLGGAQGDWGVDVALNTAGDAFVAGSTASPDFPVTPGIGARTGGSGPFVTRISASGSTLGFSNLLGRPSQNVDIAVDDDSHSYVTMDGDMVPAVAKLGGDGWVVVYTELKGSGALTSIALDGARNVYLTGYTFSPDFPTTPGAFDRTPPTSGDAFVVKLNLTAPGSKDDCRGGAWKNQAPPGGEPFQNQGACVSYVSSSRR